MSQSSAIPTKIIRHNLDQFAAIAQQQMHQPLDLNTFPVEPVSTNSATLTRRCFILLF